MKGIQFVSDEKGRKTGVLIDLQEHGRLWEDFYDGLCAEERKQEPRVSWDLVKDRLNLPGQVDG